MSNKTPKPKKVDNKKTNLTDRAITLWNILLFLIAAIIICIIILIILVPGYQADLAAGRI